MRGALALRTPCGAAATVDTSSTNVTSSAYVELQSAVNMTSAASGVVVSNSGTQPIKMATGASGSEVDTGILIPPLCEGLFVAIPLKKSTRISLRSLGGTQSTGFISIMYVQ